MIEAADKLLVRALQCRFGVNAIEAAGIHKSKEEVANLIREVLLVLHLQLGIHLRKLLLDLCPYILSSLPIKSRGGRLLAYAEGLDHRWQRYGDTAQRAALAILLAQLQRLPILLHLLGGVGMHIAIYMRVAIYQLVADAICHLRVVKCPLLLAELRVEYDVQQQVAKLLFDTLHILIRDGIGKLIGLLYGVVAQRVEGLLPVPRTLAAQRIHHIK